MDTKADAVDSSDVASLLKYAHKNNASDLHLSTGVIPVIRVDGKLQPVQGAVANDEVSLKKISQQILPKEFLPLLETKREIDKSFGIDKVGRFRVNIFQQSNGLGISIRLIPEKIPTFSDIGLTDIFTKLCELPHGLVLVTGPTGSGKSTTIASMIDYINATRNGHVITLEDPIEYVYENKQCLVHQREVGRHTESFGDALRACLRQDPDFILVGEMRDLETIRLALTAAETGHLVFATLHTSSTSEAINRIIDVFPSFEKAMVRSILASSLRAVVSQVLLRRKGTGRVAAQEVMICNSAIKNMIREDRTHQIYSVIQTGQEKGMRTLAQHLQDLVRQGIIPDMSTDEIGLGKGA